MQIRGKQKTVPGRSFKLSESRLRKWKISLELRNGITSRPPSSGDKMARCLSFPSMAYLRLYKGYLGHVMNFTFVTMASIYINLTRLYTSFFIDLNCLVINHKASLIFRLFRYAIILINPTLRCK
jgi:hypothetical protein